MSRTHFKRFALLAAISIALTGFAGSARGVSDPAEARVTLGFTEEIIDQAKPANPHCKAVGDINGDGLPDIVVASNSAGPMVWYQAPGWQKHVMVGAGYWTTDMQLGDVDGDGDLDVIIGAGREVGVFVHWYENPRPNGNPATDEWIQHPVGAGHSHDVEAGDMNNDGKLDIVTESGVFLQSSPDSWLLVDIGRWGEGTGLGDLDGDGDLDIAAQGLWFENPLPDGNFFSGEWTRRFVGSNHPALVGATVGDLNGDGRNDIIVGPSESAGRFVWYEAPEDPKNWAWKEHLLDGDVAYMHTFKMVDIDNDGDQDLVTAQMHQAPKREVAVYLNDGAALGFDKMVLSNDGSHNIRVVDIDLDGDLDIVGANWNDTAPDGAPLKLWRNNLRTGAPDRLRSSVSRSSPLDNWNRVVIDGARPWRAMFVLHGDLNGDDLPDVVSGGWWYRNPGADGGPWTRTAFGSPLNNAVVLHDFDGDGDLDVLGTQGEGETPNAAFAWARNDGEGRFTVLTNIQAGQGDFLQGVAAARFQPSGPVEVALSWHNTGGGIQMLTVPADPSNEQWGWRLLTEATLSEELSAGDFDNDGDLDLQLGYLWLRNDGDTWPLIGLGAPATEGDPDRNRLGDINRDGRLDVVVGFEAISVPGKLAWYEQPADLSAPWAERLIATMVGPMSVDVVDMDGDGDLDVVAGEHNLDNPAGARLFVYENTDGAGTAWASHLVHTGDEHHDGAQVVDIDGDGDLDIISIGWGHGQVVLYENTSPRIITAATASEQSGGGISVTTVGLMTTVAAVLTGGLFFLSRRFPLYSFR